ncbi:hypothetical protein CC2G_012596 [Coprinopsis cinerea AmutBmut pab1-1]|nr:hypothetical protein CC2G_012596 [Coprinopsis cinerea AmutBmut pab1-1]
MVRYTSSAALFLLSLYSPLQVSAQSLASAVSSRPELSTFLTVVSSFPDLVESVSSSGGTILAPSNNAFSSFLEAANLGPEGLAAVPESTVRSLLTYHVLPETLRSTDLVVRGGAVAETALSDNEEFANLDGDPNVVFASAFGSAGLDEGNVGTLRIYSGAGNPANVSSADIEFDNGVIHVIESVLNLPQTPSKTAEAAALSVLISALESTNLTSTVDSTPKLTILAPTDDAFAALGIDLSSLSTDELAEILKYHVIVGAVGYSTVLEDAGRPSLGERCCCCPGQCYLEQWCRSRFEWGPRPSH